jgi:hypothetical protein
VGQGNDPAGVAERRDGFRKLLNRPDRREELGLAPVREWPSKNYKTGCATAPCGMVVL